MGGDKKLDVVQTPQAGVKMPEDGQPVVFPKDHYVTKKYGDKIKVRPPSQKVCGKYV